MSRPVDPSEWTAFALGELDPARQAELEALLAHDAESQQLVAETRATARRLVEAMRSEALPSASSTLAASVSRAQHTEPSWHRGSLPRIAWRAIRIAAMFFVAVALGGSWLVVHRAWQANDLGPVAMVAPETDEAGSSISVQSEAEYAPAAPVLAEAMEQGRDEAAAEPAPATIPKPNPPAARKVAVASGEVRSNAADLAADRPQSGAGIGPRSNRPLKLPEDEGLHAESLFGEAVRERSAVFSTVRNAMEPHPFPFVRRTKSWDQFVEAIMRGDQPSTESLRIEEVIQAYPFAEAPADREIAKGGIEPAVTATLEGGPCPWRPEARLARLAIRTRPNPGNGERHRAAVEDLRVSVQFSPDRVRAVRWLGSEPKESGEAPKPSTEYWTGQFFVALYEWEPIQPDEAKGPLGASPWATLEVSYLDMVEPDMRNAERVQVKVSQANLADSLSETSADYRLSATAAWIAMHMTRQKEHMQPLDELELLGDELEPTPAQAELLKVFEKIQVLDISGDTE